MPREEKAAKTTKTNNCFAKHHLLGRKQKIVLKKEPFPNVYQFQGKTRVVFNRNVVAKIQFHLYKTPFNLSCDDKKVKIIAPNIKSG